MSRTRIAAFLLGSILLAAGCSTAPTSAPPSGRSSETPPASQHVVAGPVSLDAPASWHVRPGLPNPSGNVTLVYLGPQDLPSDCEATAQGGVCHGWPVMELVPGGLAVAVRQNGMPGSEPPAGGVPITVGGRPGRRISGSADEGCRAIGGAVSVSVVLPALAGETGWMALDACLAGPHPAAAEAAFSAIVGSVTIAGD